MLQKLIFFLLSFSLTLQVFAGEKSKHKHKHKHTKRKGHAHVHGQGKVNIAVEQKKLMIEFELPADDVLGFEHKPKSKKEQQALDQATAKLNVAKNVVQLPAAAECKTAEATKVNAKLADKAGGHAEFHIVYGFQCDNPKELNHLEILLFDTFPNAKKIKAQAITETGPFTAKLDKNNRMIRLRK